jgi:hypothetical protein
MPPRHSPSVPLLPRGSQGMLPSGSMRQPRRCRYDSLRVHNRDAAPRQHQAQAGGWGREPILTVLGLGIEAVQGMTNAMKAIANKVI